MHYFPFMHVLESLAKSFHYVLNLSRRKFVLCLDFVVKLTALQKLHCYVNRILRLEYTIKLHEVFMVQLTIDLNFIDKRLFAILLLISAFLWKGFNSIFLFVLIFDDQINGSKISLSNFFNGFKQLMKSSLIDFVF